MSDLILIANSVDNLTGRGTEYLVIDGEVIAKFENGNIADRDPIGNTEATIKAA